VQDVSDVFNPLYKPATGDKDIFEAKQRYMYAVFERVLQMDKGKALMKSYESTTNAQKIFNDLCQDALWSTCSLIDSLKLLSYIASGRIGDG